MSDFISVTEGITPSAVYSESYDWAEEYADVYEVAASQHTLDIYDSSDYKFFGEACFYQEASKGLIAGGILALVSGAFFMIMKLLKGKGGGGGGSSGSDSSNSSSKTQTSKQQPRQPQKTSATKPNNQPANNFNVSNFKNDYVKAGLKDQLLKDIPEEDKTIISDIIDKNVDKHYPSQSPDTKNVVSPTPKETKVEKPRTEKPAEKPKYQKPADLEAEEKSVFINIKSFKKLIKNYKNKGEDSVSIYGDAFRLSSLIIALEGIEDITNDMCKHINEQDDGKFDWFSSNMFINKKKTLDKFVQEAIATSRQLSGSDESDKREDINISELESYINEMDQLVKGINENCKKGINICKKWREKYISNQKDVSNIDTAYNTLNGVIRNVNKVVNMMNDSFNKIKTAIRGKTYKFPVDGSKLSSVMDILKRPDSALYWLTHSKKLMDVNDGNFIHGVRSVLLNDFSAVMDGITALYGKINDEQIQQIKSENIMEKCTKAISNYTSNVLKDLDKLRKMYPYPKAEAVFDKIGDIIRKFGDALISFYSTPIDELVDKWSSEAQSFVNLLDVYHTLCDNDGNLRSSYVDELLEGLKEAQDEIDQGSKDSYAK